MQEALVVKGIEDDIDLLLKERPVGLLVAQLGAERFHLARVVAATDAKDDAAACEDVNGGEVLCQPQRVPHRSDIEAATNLDVFRSVREVQCHKDRVGNAFSAFALEVMLGHPETVVAKAIHERGHGLGLTQRSCEVGVRVPPLVDGRPAITDVVEVGMTGIEAVKLGDHRELSVPYQPRPDCRVSNSHWPISGYGEDAGGASALFACVRSLRRTTFDSRPYTASPQNDGMWGYINKSWRPPVPSGRAPRAQRRLRHSPSTAHR